MAHFCFLIALGAALAYGAVWTLRPISWLRSALKTAATACLFFWALLLGAQPLICAGLAFGVVGDFCLSRRRDVGFLPGLAAFALGHGLYFLWAVRQLSSADSLLLSAALMAAIALVLCRAIWAGLGALKGPVLFYVALSVALGAIAGAELWALWAVGLMAFIASDVVLALALFRLDPEGRAARGAAILLWALYWSGQALIVLGAVRI